MTERSNPGSISLLGVYKSFGTSTVLQNCSFEVADGSFTALVGPSGCGKTTLINLVAGYDTADDGRVELNGRAVRGPGWDRLVVFQETALFPWKSTLKNVMFGPINRGMSATEADRSARELLAKFGLAGFESKYPNQLSGGMQRRAELARAMINSPKVMLMDEPFRGLDAMSRGLMQEYLRRVFEENVTTTLFVTTEIEEAIYLADRVVVLSGRPTSVKQVVNVDLPRPRNTKMLASVEFGRLHEMILDSLFDDASKATYEDSDGLRSTAGML